MDDLREDAESVAFVCVVIDRHLLVFLQNLLENHSSFRIFTIHGLHEIIINLRCGTRILSLELPTYPLVRGNFFLVIREIEHVII